MNFVNLTIEDCIKIHQKGIAIIINNGNVTGFKEEIPTQTANPSGDE